MKEFKTEAITENLHTVLEFIDGQLELIGCPMKPQMQIDIAAEEIFVNIASCAYPDGPGEAEIRISAEDGAVTMTFLDSGIPYDPLAREDPDVTLSAEERQIGGLGVFLVKKNTDSVSYRYENGQNVLTLTKKIGF